MTRKEFEEMDFDEAMEKLHEESDVITTYDILKDFAKKKIDEDDIGFAKHILDSIWESSACFDSNWYRYDYSMGKLETPIEITCIEDIENLLEG